MVTLPCSSDPVVTVPVYHQYDGPTLPTVGDILSRRHLTRWVDVRATVSSMSDALALLAKLRGQRQHVLAALDGLSDAQLRTAVPPMTWAPIAALHHLALDVERWWFQAVVANDAPALDYFEANPGGAWSVAERSDVFSLYEGECKKSDAVISAVGLDSTPAAWPEYLGPIQTVGQIVLHVIVETATHAGQLDIVREMLDGRQYRVLD